MRDKILEKLKSSLEEIHASGRTEGRKAQIPTLKVKETLYKLGKDLDYRPYGSGLGHLDKTTSEWLYDFHWRQTTNKFRIKSLPLVVESETGNKDEVLLDFLKLIQSRAEVRLMIYNCPEDGIVEEMIEMINAFDGTQAGDFYLFAEWRSSQIHWKEHQV